MNQSSPDLARGFAIIPFNFNFWQNFESAITTRDNTNDTSCTKRLTALLDHSATVPTREHRSRSDLSNAIRRPWRDFGFSISVRQDSPFEQRSPDHSTR